MHEKVGSVAVASVMHGSYWQRRCNSEGKAGKFMLKLRAENWFCQNVLAAMNHIISSIMMRYYSMVQVRRDVVVEATREWTNTTSKWAINKAWRRTDGLCSREEQNVETQKNGRICFKFLKTHVGLEMKIWCSVVTGRSAERWPLPRICWKDTGQPNLWRFSRECW